MFFFSLFMVSKWEVSVCVACEIECEIMRGNKIRCM